MVMSFIALIGLVILLITATVLIEVENFTWATITLVLCVGVAQLYHLVDFALYARQHALISLLYVIAYLVAGVAWSFIKWFSFLIGFREKYHQLKRSFLAREDLGADTQWTPVLASKFDSFIGLYTTYHGNNLRA